jgi:type II secretory pathway component HofQ
MSVLDIPAEGFTLRQNLPPKLKTLWRVERIRDGEIKAIGGLTMTVATDRESGIPLLRDIPVAGKLANDEGIDYQQVEFVILLQVKRLN